MVAISESNLAIITTVGSTVAAVVTVCGVARNLIPTGLHNYASSRINHLIASFSNRMTLVIDEYDGLVSNGVYSSAEIYLGTKISRSTRRLKINRPEKEKNYKITREAGEEMIDVFNGQKSTWVWIFNTSETSNPRGGGMIKSEEVRSFELTFHRKNYDMVIHSYLPHVETEAKILKQRKKTIRIFTVDYEAIYRSSDLWKPVTLDHPSTFETLAIDFDLKETILKDLDRFVRRRDYYRRVGKAWKRGYLLYGPPGTGKSSLIAAMANYLNFDIFDLELTSLKRNWDLKKLLLGTTNKSILVVEDIDCSIDWEHMLANRGDSSSSDCGESQITLSGLLNLVDGLWSSCGDEKIIVFTTNHVEKLDPALLRPGRMDVHIHMSYCTASGFKVLASNYLGIADHRLFEDIEDWIQDSKVTPAEVAEQLLKEDDHTVALEGLIDFLLEKIKVNEAKSAEEERE